MAYEYHPPVCGEGVKKHGQHECGGCAFYEKLEISSKNIACYFNLDRETEIKHLSLEKLKPKIESKLKRR